MIMIKWDLYSYTDIYIYCEQRTGSSNLFHKAQLPSQAVLFPKGGRPENLKFGMEGVATHQSSWMSSPKLAPCANSYGCKQLPPTSSPVRTRAYVATAKCPVEKLDNITSRSRMVKWLHCWSMDTENHLATMYNSHSQKSKQKKISKVIERDLHHYDSCCEATSVESANRI